MEIFRKLALVASMPLLCALATSVLAQLSSGTILGTVTDASGAVVPGATVKIVNPATNLTREVITNEDGNFRVDQLPIGLYQVEFEKAGFRKEIRAGVKVDIDQRARVDAALSAGTVTEVININAEASLVQKDDASLGQVIEERKIVTLPLNGRNFSQLAYIVPGAFAPRTGSQLNARGGFAVAGMHWCAIPACCCRIQTITISRRRRSIGTSTAIIRSAGCTIFMTTAFSKCWAAISRTS